MARLLIKTLTELAQCRPGRLTSSVFQRGPRSLISIQNAMPGVRRHVHVCTYSRKLHLAPRLLEHAALDIYTRMQSVASLCCGEQFRETVSPQRNVFRRNYTSGDIVTFIKDDGDYKRFLGHVTELLSTPDFSKVKIAKDDAERRVEELVQRLVDMKADPKNIYSFLRSNPRVLNTRWDVLMPNIQYLDELHLFSNRCLLVLDRNPQIWNTSLEFMKERVRKLRKLGLVEGSLQRVITSWPGVLTLKTNRLNGCVEVLRKCQFSGKQITEIIVGTPEVLGSDPADIELRFQYVYFSMGLQSQADMVQANLFKYSLEHIRRRHLVLEKLGVYEMPNKHGKTREDNPKLCRIVDCTDVRFAQKCAGISLGEFEMFWRNLEEEERQEEEVGTDKESDEDFEDHDDSRQG